MTLASASQPAVYPSLKGRVVIVSGGATGIGADIVRGFARQGAKVGFLDLQDEEGIALVREIEDRGGEAAFAVADVADIPALRDAIASLRSQLGPVRVLVNNAANDQRHSFETLTPEEWDSRLAVNLKHHVFAAQAVVPDMKAAGSGSIVNLSSISYLRGMSEMPAYTTSKAAVVGLTRSLARDLGPFEIRVNAVLPGWIMTDRQLALWVTPESEKEIYASQCLKRKLLPLEVTNMILFLASDDASACTSQSFIVDGGWV